MKDKAMKFCIVFLNYVLFKISMSFFVLIEIFENIILVAKRTVEIKRFSLKKIIIF